MEQSNLEDVREREKEKKKSRVKFYQNVNKYQVKMCLLN